MGLVRKQQNGILLMNGSDFGLADHIQNTAICLRLINENYLRINRNFDDEVSINVLYEFTKDIGYEAVKIQKELEK
jgi:hypothetical protein